MSQARKLRKVENSVILSQDSLSQSSQIAPSQSSSSKNDDIDSLIICYFLANPIIDEETLFSSVLKNIIKKDHFKWEIILGNINQKLLPVDLQIGNVFDEMTGEKYWGIASTKFDIIGQLATQYTPTEIAYLKLILKEIIAPESGSSKKNGRLGKLNAKNLSTLIQEKEKSFNKSKSENVLKVFVNDNWLTSTENYYYLGKRSLLELAGWLQDHYAEFIVECFLCSDDVYYGIPCSNQRCESKIHIYCSEEYKKNSNGKSLNCPKCNTPFTQLNVGEYSDDE